MGTSHSVFCIEVTKEIWSFCINCCIWFSAAYVPGKENVEAGEESRRINFDTEWQIVPDLLWHALSILDYLLLGLIVNAQLMWLIGLTQKLWHALTLSRSGIKFCAFPPFCVISSMLQKITKDKAQGTAVVPFWPKSPREGSIWPQQVIACSSDERLSVDAAIREIFAEAVWTYFCTQLVYTLHCLVRTVHTLPALQPLLPRACQQILY